MNFLEIKPCIQHCKFISGSAIRIYQDGDGEAGREEEMETDTSVDFIDIKIRILLFFVIFWIVFSVKLIICLRFQFISLPMCCYHSFFSHDKMTHKHTIHIEQTSVQSVKVPPSNVFPLLSH